MISLAKVCLATVILWESMHVWHGLMLLDLHAVAPLGIVAILLCIPVVCRACAPLATGEVRLGRGRSVIITTLGIGVSALVIPFLQPLGVQSYANWTLGAIGPVIAALVMRRRPWSAVALSLATCVIVSATVVRLDLAQSWALSLSFPPLLWLGASFLVRRVFDQTQVVVGGYGAAERAAVLRAKSTSARASVAATRRSELRLEVIPLMEQIAVGDCLSSDLRASCGEVASHLRDNLRARSVLTPELREVMARTRHAGTRLTVVDDRDEPADDETAVRARAFITSIAHLLHGSDVTIRICADGSMLTMVAKGSDDGLREAGRFLESRPGVISTYELGVLFARCV